VSRREAEANAFAISEEIRDAENEELVGEVDDIDELRRSSRALFDSSMT
jgi:hypothetical protein